jgi:hypothetical protein
VKGKGRRHERRATRSADGNLGVLLRSISTSKRSFKMRVRMSTSFFPLWCFDLCFAAICAMCACSRLLMVLLAERSCSSQLLPFFPFISFFLKIGVAIASLSDFIFHFSLTSSAICANRTSSDRAIVSQKSMHFEHSQKPARKVFRTNPGAKLGSVGSSRTTKK